MLQYPPFILISVLMWLLGMTLAITIEDFLCGSGLHHELVIYLFHFHPNQVFFQFHPVCQNHSNNETLTMTDHIILNHTPLLELCTQFSIFKLKLKTLFPSTYHTLTSPAASTSVYDY
jgi:hypothetical protein